MAQVKQYNEQSDRKSDVFVVLAQWIMRYFRSYGKKWVLTSFLFMLVCC
jgi:hypothetical protein